ncbi:DUF397 domain-containing protein [Streptomyces sp. NPDC001840]
MNEQLNWFKSSYSGQPNTDCVDAAFLANQEVAVRDSKYPDGPRHRFGSSTWMSFIGAVKEGALETSAKLL